jgi:hypothetical protein
MSFGGSGGDEAIFLTGKELDASFDLIDHHLADED